MSGFGLEGPPNPYIPIYEFPELKKPAAAAVQPVFVRPEQPEKPKPEKALAVHVPEEYTITWRLLNVMHVQLGSIALCQYVHSLRTVEALHGSLLPTWSCFAGSGISTWFRRMVCMFWAKHYGVQLQLPTVAYAEHKTDKRDWLTCQYGGPSEMVLVDKVQELRRISVSDVRGGPSTILRQPWLVEAGVPCTSRSSLNMNSKQLVDCVQNEVGETGIGFKQELEIFSSHGPRLGITECVHGLWQRSAEGKMHDAEHMVMKFQRLQYWCIAMQSDQVDYGAWNARRRGYWGSSADIEPLNEDANAWFSSMMSGFKVSPAYSFKAEDFLDLTDDDRRASALNIGIPSVLDLGLREELGGQAQPPWKSEFKVLFHLSFGHASWPIEDFNDSPSWLRLEGLLPREREMMFFLDKAFPPPEVLPDKRHTYFEFLDINCSIQRHVKAHVNQETGERKGTPWTSNPPTLVGGGKIVMRFWVRAADAGRSLGKFWQVRKFECWEEARLAGWDDSWWSSDVAYKSSWSHKRAEVVSNLMGNMFSVFNYIPFFCALVSTAGKYSKNA